LPIDLKEMPVYGLWLPVYGYRLLTVNSEPRHLIPDLTVCIPTQEHGNEKRFRVQGSEL